MSKTQLVHKVKEPSFSPTLALTTWEPLVANKQTDRTENITFPQTTYVGGNTNVNR